MVNENSTTSQYFTHTHTHTHRVTSSFSNLTDMKLGKPHLRLETIFLDNDLTKLNACWGEYKEQLILQLMYKLLVSGDLFINVDHSELSCQDKMWL